MAKKDGIKEYIANSLPYGYRRKIQKVMSRFASYGRHSLRPPFPSSIIIDPVNVCNLECPLCPTGLKKLDYQPAVMSLDTFKMILEKIPSLEHMCLFNWGEPFLNPSIFKMIRHARDKNIRVTIHSHFSFDKNDDFFQNILESKLDTLVVSLDGATGKSYSQYRRGGDFNLVLANVMKLAEMKKEQDCRNPNVIWKFIVNRFNEEEIAQAQSLAERLGVQFQVDFLGLSDDLPDFDPGSSLEQRKKDWLPKEKKHRHPYYREEYRIPLDSNPCSMLFDTVVVNANGKLFPCCWVTNEKNTFGDLTKDSFEDIWHNAQYRFSRSLFIKEDFDGDKEESICSVCKNFTKVK